MTPPLLPESLSQAGSPSWKWPSSCRLTWCQASTGPSGPRKSENVWQHVRAESYLVYSVMSSGEVECSSSLEDATDQALPSQAFVYRPVRQRVYSLLLGGGGGECTWSWGWS